MTDVTTGESSTADTTTTTETAATATGAAGDAGAELQTQETGTTTEVESGNESTVPEAYEFTVPDGMAVDEKLVGRITPVLQKLKLTQEDANELVAPYIEHLAELAAGSGEAFDAAYIERRQAEVAAQVDADLTALKADKELGGPQYDVVNKRVMDFIGSQGTPEFRAFVDANGIGNNPEFVRVIDRAIRYTPTDTGETPSGAGGATASFAERMYANANKVGRADR